MFHIMIMFNHYYTISRLPFDSQQSCCRRGEYIICIGFILSTCVCGLLFVWTVSCELFFVFAASPGMMVHHQSQSDMHRDVIAVVKVTVFKLPQ